MLATLAACPAGRVHIRACRKAYHSSISRVCVHARPVVVARAAPGSAPQRSEAAEAAILQLTDDLRVLETERDEAVKTAEDCAKTAVKLEEMVRLLEKLALNKVAEDDDAGARQVLQEKAAVQEVLSRTSSRANTNYALAAKLAEKIGQQQSQIMDLLSPGTTSTVSSSSSPATAGARLDAVSKRVSMPHYGFDSASCRRSTGTTTTSSSRSSTSAGMGGSNGNDFSSSSSSSSSSPYEAPWERSLREARDRVAAVEAEATAAGAAAGWRARETIEEARERLRQQSFESVAAARSRIRRSATESIEEARARIAAEDAAALAEVHKVIARYKGGGYVSDAELDWAFAQLEKRSWR